MNEVQLMDKAEAKVLLLFLLKKLNEISESFDIPIYASGGTCLGMLRHQGMIPWDDDIDIMIFRKDYDRLAAALQQNLPPPIVLRTRENDPFFYQEFMKLCYLDDDGNYSALSIDIFELDETDLNRPLFRAYQDRILRALYYIKMYKVSRMGHGNYRPNNPLKRLLLSIGGLLPLKTIDRWHRRTMTAEKKEGDYVVNWGAAYSYKKATYPKEAFGTPIKRSFENTYVWSEEHPEMILERLYGKDYMTLPPEEKRTDHGINDFICSALDFERIKKEIGF